MIPEKKKKEEEDVQAEVEIAREGTQMLKETTGASDEEAMEAFLKLKETKESETPDPGVVEKRNLIALAPSKAKDVAAVEASQTGKRTETMAALLSLVLPVLAGAAIGGKRGALHATSGAGKGMLKTLDQEREDRKEVEKAAAAEATWQRRFDQQEAGKTARVQAKIDAENSPEARANKLEQIREEEIVKGRAKGVVQRENDFMDFESRVSPMIDNGYDILDDMREFKDNETGTFNWQLQGRLPKTEIGKLKARVNFWRINMLKELQGSRASDLDLKALDAALQGNWTSDAPAAYGLLEQALGDFEGIMEARRKLAMGDSLSRRDESLLESAKNRGTRKLSPLDKERLQLPDKTTYALGVIADNLENMEELPTLKEVKEEFNNQGVPLPSDELLKSMGFE